jgi:hypothetical protein
MLTRNMPRLHIDAITTVKAVWREMFEGEKNEATEFAKREMNWLWLVFGRATTRSKNPVTLGLLKDGVYREDLAFSFKHTPSPSVSRGGLNSPSPSRGSPPRGSPSRGSPSTGSSRRSERLRDLGSNTPQTGRAVPIGGTLPSSAGTVAADSSKYRIINWELKEKEEGGVQFEKMQDLAGKKISSCTYVLLTLETEEKIKITKSLYDFFTENEGYEALSLFRKNDRSLQENRQERDERNWYFRENYFGYSMKGPVVYEGYRGLQNVQKNEALYPAMVFGSYEILGDTKGSYFGAVIQKYEKEDSFEYDYYNKKDTTRVGKRLWTRFNQAFVLLELNQNIISAQRRSVNDLTKLQDAVYDDDDLMCSVSAPIKEGSTIGQYVKQQAPLPSPVLLKYKLTDTDLNCFMVLKVVEYRYNSDRNSETLCCDFGHYFAKVVHRRIDKEFVNACPTKAAIEQVMQNPIDGNALSYGRFRFFNNFSNLEPLVELENDDLSNAAFTEREKKTKLREMCSVNKDRDVFNQNMLLRAYCQSKVLKFQPNKESNSTQSSSFVSAWLNHGILCRLRDVLPLPRMEEAKKSLRTQGVDVQQLVDTFRNLLGVILKAAFDVNLGYRVAGFKVIPEAAEEEDSTEPDLYATEEPDGFPFLNDMTFHWSNISTSTVSLNKKYPILSRVAYTQAYVQDGEQNLLPFSRFLSVADVDGETKDDIQEQLAGLLDVELNPEFDEFRSLVESSLLVRGQTSSLYSYLGSRAHFRASMLLAKTEADETGEYYKTKNEVLFGPHLAYGNLKYENLDRVNETSLRFEPFVGFPPLGNLKMNAKMYQYLNADADQLIETTCMNYTKVLEKDSKDENRRLCLSISRAMRKGTGQNYEVLEYEHVGTEVPVFNPHIMVKKAKDIEHRYRFISTQVDFVGIAKAKLANQNLDQSFLVMGEFKTLMEKDNAANRVTLDRTFFQVLTNAFLFEMMTGTCPDVVIICFLQRRRRKHHRTNLHAGLYIKEAIYENNSLGRALRRIRAMVTTNIRLTRNAKSSDVSFLYVDDEHLVSKKTGDVPTAPLLADDKRIQTSFWFGYPNIRMNLQPKTRAPEFMPEAMWDVPIVTTVRKHNRGGAHNLAVDVNNLWSAAAAAGVVTTYSNATETVIVNKANAEQNFEDSFDWNELSFESSEHFKETNGVLQRDAFEQIPDNHAGMVVLGYLIKDVEPTLRRPRLLDARQSFLAYLH